MYGLGVGIWADSEKLSIYEVKEVEHAWAHP